MLDLNNESEESRAFNDADSLTFKKRDRATGKITEEIPLAGFSFAHQRAAAALGLRYGTGKLSPGDFRSHQNPRFARKAELEKIIKAAGKKAGPERREAREELEKLGEQPEEITTYDGMGEDAAIVVFVCSLRESEVRQVRRQPIRYEEKFEDWAEENGVGIDGENLTEAITVFAEIIAGLNASKSEPLIPDAKGSSDSPNG